MARTPLGVRPQPETQAALFAYFAARLSGIPAEGFDAFFQGLGLAVRRNGALRAMRPLRYQPPGKGLPGRKPSRPRRAGRRAGFRDWILIDESAVDVETALIRFPGTGARQTDLISALRTAVGVRQVFETAHKRDVYAMVLFRGRQERRRLRARLEELAEKIVWDDVLWETHESAIATWCDLARGSAIEEGLIQ